MAKRTIIFHVGQPKTGSSALQAFLSQNAGKLAECGISYPFPEAAETIASGYCSGNLMHTMQRIAKSDDANSDRNALGVRDLFENYLTNAVEAGLEEAELPTVLFSAEGLASPVAEVALDVLKQLNKSYRVKVVCFVRDPYDFAMSAWKQVTKSGRRSDDFEAFVTGRVAKQSFGLERIVRYTAIAEDVKLINYDVHRKTILASFLDAIGVSDAMSDFNTPSRSPSNPSLSFSQAATLVRARQTVKSPLFNAMLTKRFRHERMDEQDPYFQDVDKLILDFLKDALETVNRLLPDGEKLRTNPRSAVDPTASAVSLHAVQSAFEVLNEALKLDEIPDNTPGKAGLPDAFDPRVYLLLNPDLEAAGADPVEHYLNSGRFEGRIYK